MAETKELTADQWRHIAVVALSDLQALGMDLSWFIDAHSRSENLTDVERGQNTTAVLQEVDRYMWERENYQ